MSPLGEGGSLKRKADKAEIRVLFRNANFLPKLCNMLSNRMQGCRLSMTLFWFASCICMIREQFRISAVLTGTDASLEHGLQYVHKSIVVGITRAVFRECGLAAI